VSSVRFLGRSYMYDEYPDLRNQRATYVGNKTRGATRSLRVRQAPPHADAVPPLEDQQPAEDDAPRRSRQGFM